MDKYGMVILFVFTLVSKIKRLFRGDETTGKNEFCKILLMHLYVKKSLHGIDIKEIMEIINRKYNCDLERIFRLNNLSSELYCFLYENDNTFSNDEMRVINDVIAKERDIINSLFAIQKDSPIKQYVDKNIYWFLVLFILTYGSAWINLLVKGGDPSYLLIALLTSIYIVIAALLILVPDCMLWIADKSNVLDHGCLVHFLERKYNQYSWVKSFFDYHTKKK